MSSTKNAYARTINLGKYDLAIADNHQRELFNEKILAKDVPKRMYELTKSDGAGCCLNYALSMLYLLLLAGVEAFLVGTPEEDFKGGRSHTHASVCYIIDSQMFFADPVKAVMGKEGDFSRIEPKIFLKEMLQEGEAANIYRFDGIYGEAIFFGEFLNSPLKKIRREDT